MDLQISSETFTTADLSWLRSKHGLDTAASATVLLSACVEATHYPEGRLKPGIILGKYTSGANTGLWAPYVQDDTAAEGLGTAAGVILDGFTVRRDKFSGALVATVTSGSVILAGVPAHVLVSKLPGLLLEDGTTAYAPVAADLPSAFIAR